MKRKLHFDFRSFCLNQAPFSMELVKEKEKKCLSFLDDCLFYTGWFKSSVTKNLKIIDLKKIHWVLLKTIRKLYLTTLLPLFEDVRGYQKLKITYFFLTFPSFTKNQLPTKVLVFWSFLVTNKNLHILQPIENFSVLPSFVSVWKFENETKLKKIRLIFR